MKNIKREEAIIWWKNLGGNPVLRLIRQGELTTKHFDFQRIPKSLTGMEIEMMYNIENK